MACPSLILDETVVRAKFIVFSPDLLDTWVTIWPRTITNSTAIQAKVSDIKQEVKESISYYRNVRIAVYRAMAQSPKGQELPDDFAVGFKSWLYIKVMGGGEWTDAIPGPVSAAAS
eukprot:1385623-Pyramimonas_sp.AAC.1